MDMNISKLTVNEKILKTMAVVEALLVMHSDLPNHIIRRTPYGAPD
jgi:hypothetical protein